MRLLKCKKSRLIFGLCSALLSVLLSLSGLLSTSLVSAYSNTWYSGVWRYRTSGSTWSTYVASGERVLVPAGTSIDRWEHVQPNWVDFPQPFVKNQTYIFSGTFIWQFDYSSNGSNTPVSFTCPTIADPSWFSNVDCDSAITTDVSGSQHYVIYSWSNVAVAQENFSVGYLDFATFLKNVSGRDGYLYSSPISIAFGNIETTTDTLHAFNLDISTRLQSLLDATNAFKSSFEAWGISTQQQLTAILNAIGQSGTTQQGVENAINNSIDDQRQQSEQDFQDTQDDAQDSADDSADDASDTGTTLLGAFSNFLSALTNQQATTCVINADIGRFRMGNVDLCELDPPPAFQAITSIMVIGFTVPLSIALGRKIISLFRSFQS